MKFPKAFEFAAAGCVAAALSACSDGSSSSKADNVPQGTDITVSACQTVDDEVLNERLAQAETWALEAVNAGAKTQFEAMQAEIDSAHSIFQEVIGLYPNSCEAQFGLSLTLLAEAANDPFLDSVYHILNSGTESEKYGLINIDVESYANAAFKAAAMAKSNSQAGLITERAQRAIAGNFLPKTDSALALLKNVKKAGDFSYTIHDGDYDFWVLDPGDLDMAIGGVEALNAFLTVLASFDLDASKDNSYNYTKYFDSLSSKKPYIDTLTAEEIAALKHAASLFSENSPFLTVKSSWKSAYAAVPATLDSAVESVKSGLQYKIATAGQNSHSLYIVGNGEDADVSPDDLQAVVNTCDSLLKSLRGTVRVTLYGEEVALDVSKFFGITDGFQDYLPYFEFTDVSTWLNLPDVEYGWTSDWEGTEEYGDSTVFASLEIIKQFKLLTKLPLESFDIWYSSYSHDLTLEYETEDDWDYLTVAVDGCRFHFSTDIVVGTDSTKVFSLPEELCKTESGVTYYKTFADGTTAMVDFLYFTDKNGNKTVSTSELHQMDDEEKTAEFYAENILFPDPTFGGVFPEMTQSQIGRILYQFFEVGE